MNIKTSTKLSGGLGNMSKAFTISASEMKRIGLSARKRMNDRINTGKDINSTKFKPYSTGYQMQKAKLGKSTTNVDMRNSGTMRNSIKVGGKINVATIMVTLHRLIGHYHQTGTAKGGKIREWFGLAKENEDTTYKTIERRLSKQIDKEWR